MFHGLPYRREIDGLRAIAVLAVVAYHAFELPAAGFVGVDVFFVISGYLITGLLLHEWQQFGRISLSSFYARRARRLLPALFAVVAATLATANMLLFTAEEQRHAAFSAVAALLFVGNIYFQASTGGYFDGNATEMPLLHLWSLGVEEQFYLVWPAVLIVLLQRWPSALFRIVVVFAIFSFIVSEALNAYDSAAAFYQMPSRFWELAVGGLIAMRPRGALRHPSLLSAAGVAMLVVAVLAASAHFPGVGAIPAVAGAGLLLYAVHNASDLGPIGTFLASRPMVFFGLISYSLYLWHWPLLAFDAALRIEPPSWQTRTLLLSVAVMLSWLSYRFVETPVRRSRIAAVAPRKAIVLGVLVSVFGVSVAAQLAPPLVVPPGVTIPCHQAAHTKPEQLPPESCNSIPGERASLVLWGDSHALAWLPFAYELARASGRSAAGFTYGGCPPALHYGAAGAACTHFNQLAVDRISEGGFDTVILAARLLPYFHRLPDVYQGKTERLSVQDQTSFRDGFAQTVATIAPHVRRIIIIDPLPQLRAPAPRCVGTADPGLCAMSRQEFEGFAAAPRQFFRSLAQKHHNVLIVDPTSYFCGDRDCPAMRDEVVLYHDAHHISHAAARAFATEWLRGRRSKRGRRD